MRRPLRSFLLSFTLVAAPLAVLAGGAVTVVFRQLAQSRDMAAAQTLTAVTTAVADAGRALRREAALLARDPALIEGAARRDWAMLARFTSPRMLAVTRDGFADLVVVRDPTGAPLLQVPAIPPPMVPSFPALTDPIVTLRLINGQPVFLAAAPIWSPGAADDASRIPLGMVVIGRRLDRLERVFDGGFTRPGVVFVAGDRALVSTLSGTPPSGWIKAASAGRVAIDAEPFALRPLPPGIADSPEGALWALLPESPQSRVQWKIWTWLGALLAVSMVSLGLGVFLITRGGRLPAARVVNDPESRRPPVDRRSREPEAFLEAQRQIERHIWEQLDLERLLVIVAGSALRLIGGTFSVVYLREGDVLCPRAWSEVGDWIREARIPIGAGVTGHAVATGEGVIVNDYPNSPLALAPWSGLSMRLLAQPLVAGGRPLGAMVITRDETAEPFTPDDLSALADFATQAVVAIENARLFAETKRAATEYQALFEVSGLVGSTLDVDRLLDLIVDRCRALVGVASAGIFSLDRDTGFLAYERGVGLSATFVDALRVRVGEGTSGRAVRDRNPVWTADILVDPDVTLTPETRTLVTREGYRAVLSVPILSKGESEGVLSVYWWEPHVPSASEVALMSAFAGQAGIALENARLYGEAARQAERIRAVAELGRALVSSLDVNDILATVATRARDTLKVLDIGICLEPPEGGELRFLWGQDSPQSVIQDYLLESGEGVAGRAILENRPVWSPSILDDPLIELKPETRRRIEGIGTRAVLAIPLVRERPFGALVVHREAGHHFTGPEIEYLSVFASQVAVALDNARLYGALDDRAARLRTLAYLTSMMSSSLDASSVLRAIARAAAEIMRVPFVAVYVTDETAGTLELSAASDEGMGDDLPQKKRRIGESLVGWVAEHRQPLTVPDVLTDERARSREWARAHGIRGFFGVPILFQDSLLGVLALNDRVAFRLSPDDESLLESFVSQAAVAIRNTRLYAETARHLEETRALLEVAEILNSTLDPRPLLKEVAIKIAQVCRVDRCSIERWDGDQVVPLMSQFADGRRDERLWSAFMARPSYTPREVPAHALAIETRRPVLIADTSASELFPREWVDAFGHKSVLVVPLIRQDAVIGVISLDYVERVTLFEPWQMDLAMAVAGQLALSIENARLYGEAQERLRETTALLAVAQVLSQPGPAAEVMRRLAREVAHAFHADMVGVYLLDARKEALVPAAGYHVPEHLRPLFSTRPFVLARFPVITEAWRAGRAFWSSDVKNDPRIDRDTFESVDPHSVLFASTMVRGEPVGALFLVWWGQGREFQPADIRLIEGVAFQVGLAMENADLARQTQAKLEETEHLLSVSRTLASTLDLETLPRQFLRHVVGALGADCAGLWLLDAGGEWMVPVAGYHLPPERLDALRLLRLSIVQDPFFAEAARTRRSVVSTDVTRDPGVPRDLREMLPNGTLLFVPIVAKDRVLGGFGSVWWEARRELSEGELRLMEGIASQAGVALENARLFQDNQRRVEELAAAQDQLVRTEKLRALGEMASGVAHDFNNVLATILGRAQLLLGQVADPKLSQWIQVIERAALDGARTVRRLQDFTRVRRDHPAVLVDLNRVVQESLEATESAWRQESRRRGIQIEVATALTAPLPGIAGDPAELREALTNLILNALDAMPGGGKLTLSTTSAAAERVEIAVTDTGLGIPAGIRDKIFDPFFTTKGPKGTGLGLAMTYGILARHGARITVESEEGRGATFRLVFPVATEADAPAEQEPAPATAPPLRCLVVDDEETVAEVLGDMLVSAGHSVAVVGSGQEAIARVGAEAFDLVLTDLAMPGMTGWDVARAVKRMAPSARVILVSGFGVEVSPEDLRAHGVDLVLAKPLRLQDIDSAVAAVRSARDD